MRHSSVGYRNLALTTIIVSVEVLVFVAAIYRSETSLETLLKAALLVEFGMELGSVLQKI